MKIDQVRRSVSPKRDTKRKSDSVDNQPIIEDQIYLGTETHIYRYAQRQRPTSADPRQNARWYYEQGLQLKDQKATHAPFHFSDLDPPTEVHVTPKVPPRIIQRHLPTNFYPGGDGERGGIDPIAPIGRVRFQRIIPRYELSTAETRESGLGPSLERSAYPVKNKDLSASKTPSSE